MRSSVHMELAVNGDRKESSLIGEELGRDGDESPVKWEGVKVEMGVG